MGFARALLKSVCYKTSEYQAKLDLALLEFIQLSASRGAHLQLDKFKK